MKVYDNGVIRDATPEEVSAWEAARQPTPEPSPQEQAMTLARAMAASATSLTDAVALGIPDLLPTWDELLAAGNQVAAGVCLVHNGQTYRQVQSGPVTPQAHQPPGGDGMLAVYRPIEREHTGTLADPIPWVSGMDCKEGKYYRYEDKTYLCKADMIPCMWPPDTPDLWQWEVVS